MEKLYIWGFWHSITPTPIYYIFIFIFPVSRWPLSGCKLRLLYWGAQCGLAPFSDFPAVWVYHWDFHFLLYAIECCLSELVSTLLQFSYKSDDNFSWWHVKGFSQGCFQPIHRQHNRNVSFLTLMSKIFCQPEVRWRRASKSHWSPPLQSSDILIPVSLWCATDRPGQFVSAFLHSQSAVASCSHTKNQLLFAASHVKYDLKEHQFHNSGDDNMKMLNVRLWYFVCDEQAEIPNLMKW